MFPWTERVAEKLNYGFVDKELLSYYKRLIDSVIKNKKETNSKVGYSVWYCKKLNFLQFVSDFVRNFTHIKTFTFFFSGQNLILLGSRVNNVFVNTRVNYSIVALTC